MDETAARPVNPIEWIEEAARLLAAAVDEVPPRRRAQSAALANQVRRLAHDLDRDVVSERMASAPGCYINRNTSG